MSIIVLQNAFVTLALLNPEVAFIAIEAQVADMYEWEDDRVVAENVDRDDVENMSALERYALMGCDRNNLLPLTVRSFKDSYSGPEYVIADYRDDTRLIQLPENDIALVHRNLDGVHSYEVVQYVNDHGGSFEPMA